MKRFLTCVLAFMLAGQAWAAVEFTVNNLKYQVTDQANRIVWLIDGHGYDSKELVIPSTIVNPSDGIEYEVEGIVGGAIFDPFGIERVTISEGIKIIGGDSFQNM